MESSQFRQEFNQQLWSWTVAVLKLGEKFTVINMIWLWQFQKTFRTWVDDDYDPKTSFENDYAKLQGQIHSLQKFLLPEYHEMLDGGTDAQNFLTNMVRNGQLKTCNFFTDCYNHSVQNGNDDSALKYSNTPSYTGRQPNFQLQNNQSQDSWWMIQSV